MLYKKKFLPLLGVLMLCLSSLMSQPNMENLYIFGYQRSTAKIQSGTVETQKKIGNITLSGVIVNNKGVFQLDESYILGFLLSGAKRPKNFEGGVLNAGWGMTFRNREKSRWAWSADVIYRSLNVDNISWDTIVKSNVTPSTPTWFQANYIGVGGTIYYLKQFGNAVYVMPRFSLAYGGGSQVSKRCAMAQAAISIGVPFYNRWGLSITLGAYGYGKDLDQDLYGDGAREGSNVRFLQIGIARCFTTD